MALSGGHRHMSKTIDKVATAVEALKPVASTGPVPEVAAISSQIWAISLAGMTPKLIQKEVQSVLDWPPPTCMCEVQQFLSLINFCIKVIPGNANVTRPLTELSRMNVPFDWTSSCEQSFKALRVLSLLHLFLHYLTQQRLLSLSAMLQAIALVLSYFSSVGPWPTIPARCLQLSATML